MASDEFQMLLSMLFKSHPWHGVSPGDDVPEMVRAYIEIVPTGTVKLELDKATGHLMVDRPNRFSSLCPSLYGFIPQSYCGDGVAGLCRESTGLKRIQGDGDPLDICVLTERDIVHGDLIVSARPIGGLRMVDRGQADDKIIAVLEQDISYGDIEDIDDCPEGLVERLQHYFLSYKRPPGAAGRRSVVQIKEVYGRDEAHRVIAASLEDYNTAYGDPDARLGRLKALLTEAVKPRRP